VRHTAKEARSIACKVFIYQHLPGGLMRCLGNGWAERRPPKINNPKPYPKLLNLSRRTLNWPVPLLLMLSNSTCYVLLLQIPSPLSPSYVPCALATGVPLCSSFLHALLSYYHCLSLSPLPTCAPLLHAHSLSSICCLRLTMCPGLLLHRVTCGFSP
jgi:hypothetical protein